MALLHIPPVDVERSNNRALEFLDSKFSILENLDELDDAAARAINQEKLLNDELNSSSIDLEKQVKYAVGRAHELLSSAQEAALARHSLADDLASLTDELISASSKHLDGSERTLLEELEHLHEKLEELEYARTYVRIVERATRLSESAIEVFKSPSSTSSSFSHTSMGQYVALQDFVASVIDSTSSLRASADRQELKLTDFLRTLRNRTWKEIKNLLSANLLAAAERIKWPMKVDYEYLPSAERRDFEYTFSNLLRLQEYGENIHAVDVGETVEANEGKLGLYPLQALVQPIAARFKFHFDGTRPTNRLDKPEWYFTHILNVIHEHRHFMETVVQGLINQSSYKTINAPREFVSLLLPILSRKLRRTVPVMMPHPSLLAHTIYQTLIFDGSLRDEGFSTQSTSSNVLAKISKTESPQAKEWEGLSEVILGRKEWFDAWLAGEHKFADDIYNGIISSAEAWQLVDDGRDASEERESDELRPTTSARRIKALIEQVTDRYQPLPRFAHRAHFLITIQIPILESYHGRISSSLDAYETLSSSFMRSVPGALAGQVGHGVDTKRLTSGSEGLGRLYKAFVSAKFIKDAMEEWGEELFFLELWAEINEKSALRAKAAAHPSLPSTETPKLADSVDGTLFDELIVQYAKISARADEMMIRQVSHEVETELKGYLSTPWETDLAEGSSDTASIPTSLLRPLSSLSSSLKFYVQSSLPITHLSTAYKRIVSNITSHLLQRLVSHRSKGRFTSAYGKRLAADCRFWVQACEMALSSSGAASSNVRRPEFPWAKLIDTAALLSVDEAEFPDLMYVAFYGDEERYQILLDSLHLSGALGRDTLKDVVMARVDSR